MDPVAICFGCKRKMLAGEKICWLCFGIPDDYDGVLDELVFKEILNGLEREADRRCRPAQWVDWYASLEDALNGRSSL